MAAQSDSQKGGYKRRLTKSVREARSPIRTRSRSRILALQEFHTVPLSYTSPTALEYTLKRKHPHRLEPLEPISHSKKSKIKIKQRKKQCVQKKKFTRTGISNMSKSSNRHSSCRAVSKSLRVAGGGKRLHAVRPKASQRFSIGLRSGE
ncbi:hypothetical protein AVEN_252431-1 [Araneus ventricosus]|uniref:Uncharacterized protein n=1 Tax=Araneus ventricosus TaxID=182803 RepID=A0A4Y2AQP4_ARAVE|nr:hypothetical protein AVEN_252431-1 [Araneus ventricosus]